MAATAPPLPMCLADRLFCCDPMLISRAGWVSQGDRCDPHQQIPGALLDGRSYRDCSGRVDPRWVRRVDQRGRSSACAPTSRRASGRCKPIARPRVTDISQRNSRDRCFVTRRTRTRRQITPCPRRESQVVIDEFVAGSGGNSVLKLVRGALRYTSGVAKGARKVALVTPVVTIGIRGTDFWFGRSKAPSVSFYSTASSK